MAFPLRHHLAWSGLNSEVKKYHHACIQVSGRDRGNSPRRSDGASAESRPAELSSSLTIGSAVLDEVPTTLST